MAALTDDDVMFIYFFFTVFNLLGQQRNCIIHIKGLQSKVAFFLLKVQDVNTMKWFLSKLKFTQGCAYMGLNITNSIKDLVCWMQDIKARGLCVDPNYWNAAAIDQYILDVEFEKAMVNKNSDIKIPKAFKLHRWIE